MNKYSRHHKKVPIPHSFYSLQMLSPVKCYDPVTGANRNYGSHVNSVIVWFIRVNNARARASLRGYE